MARIRTLKPEFWADEKLSLLTPIDRLVFLGLVSMADDAGRLVDNVKLIDGMLFPNTDDTCRESLDILARLSRVCRYTSASGQKLIQVTGWAKHQRVDKPAKYVLPAPSPEQLAAQHVSEGSCDPREILATIPRESRAPTYDHGPTTMDRGSTTKKTKGVRRAAGAGQQERAAKPKGEPTPWMGDVRVVWQKQFPGSEPKRGTADALRPAMRDHGPDVVLPRLAVYLRKVPAQHLNLNTFAGTVLAPDWTPEGERPTGAVPVSADSPEALLTALEDGGLTHFDGNKDTYRAAADVVAARLGRDPDEFQALLRRLRPWDLRDVAFRPDRVKKLAHRLSQPAPPNGVPA